jgi:hypothetical protein
MTIKIDFETWTYAFLYFQLQDTQIRPTIQDIVWKNWIKSRKSSIQTRRSWPARMGRNFHREQIYAFISLFVWYKTSLLWVCQSGKDAIVDAILY